MSEALSSSLELFLYSGRWKKQLRTKEHEPWAWNFLTGLVNSEQNGQIAGFVKYICTPWRLSGNSCVALSEELGILSSEHREARETGPATYHLHCKCIRRHGLPRQVREFLPFRKVLPFPKVPPTLSTPYWRRRHRLVLPFAVVEGIVTDVWTIQPDD